MADVEIGAPQRPYEAVPGAERLWILPEPWKTPERPENDRDVVAAFSTAPWTGYARPQAPQPRQPLITLKAKVMYDSLHWKR